MLLYLAFLLDYVKARYLGHRICIQENHKEFKLIDTIT
ncbi:hypothetical protein M23134_05573 [Microscilla marina ATCC 23134]|uniref:Uncharacterized protein n=1 Tax=Microscilla marina ATCC 23134 TaxID=313606 RepID=A1ZI33_MICM2|nr:hypothetical protein M23134_05573 [Microscilla marina ATCC 23134]